MIWAELDEIEAKIKELIEKDPECENFLSCKSTFTRITRAFDAYLADNPQVSFLYFLS